MHTKSTLIIKIIYTMLFLIFSTGNLSAKIVLIPAFDGLIIPIVVTPDTIAPTKPRLFTSSPTTTFAESVSLNIRGEAGSKVLVNGRVVGTIDGSGKITITLNTSGANGVKNFSIRLRDSSGNTSNALNISIKKIPDPKFDTEYRGLTFYQQNMESSDYKLNQLTNAEFNALNSEVKLQVANKLLTSLFFGYPLQELKEKIGNGDFLSSVRNKLEVETTDKGWVEDYILDDTVFRQTNNQYYIPQATTILTRFYAMKDLDKYFFNNWVAYILTQTIMFSPAYELSSTHTPDISGVYNQLVVMLENNGGMRFSTYVHMMSEDNWRRFRSPEDNGREMLEIYLLDGNDKHVPFAGKALKNWKLNKDGDTLEVGLNQNTIPLDTLTNFFGGNAVVTGEDFYRELVKSNRFTKGVTRRLVNFFFPEKSNSKQQAITNSIVSSNPETWQDILTQILFSEEYLLHNNRAKSAEETFFSLAKKMEFRNRRFTFYTFKSELEKMHQASMKYKLGKIKRVPLDTLSFAYYHKFIRERILIKPANIKQTNPNNYDYFGWMPSFISNDKFTPNSNNHTATLRSFVDYLFEATIARKATNSEHNLFKNHMIEERGGKQVFRSVFNMFIIRDDPEDQATRRERYRSYIARVVLDYISRLDLTYTQREVN